MGRLLSLPFVPSVAFEGLTACTQNLLLSQGKASKQKGLEALKELYSFVKHHEPKEVDTPLESLIVSRTRAALPARIGWTVLPRDSPPPRGAGRRLRH
jgi:hypothetical protein